MIYYIVGKVMSYRQAEHVRKLIPEIDFDIITIKEKGDTDGDTIFREKDDNYRFFAVNPTEVSGGHLSFDYVNFTKPD